MALLLARIDDRLVHGQVVVGCCEPLRARRILLCDDEVAADPLQQKLFAAATPPEIQLEVHTLESASSRLGALEAEGEAEATILLVAGCAGMRALVESGAPVGSVNLGGLHQRTDTTELWPGFFLDARDRADLRSVLDLGIPVEVQTVPGAPCIDARAALEADTDRP